MVCKAVGSLVRFMTVGNFLRSYSLLSYRLGTSTSQPRAGTQALFNTGVLGHTSHVLYYSKKSHSIKLNVSVLMYIHWTIAGRLSADAMLDSHPMYRCHESPWLVSRERLRKKTNHRPSTLIDLHGDATPSAVCSPSGCCNPKEYGRPPIAYQQRSIAAGPVGYPPYLGS